MEQNVSNSVQTLLRYVKDQITEDLRNGKNVKRVLEDFNNFQDNEFDGACYVFDITNKQDIKDIFDNDNITLEVLYRTYVNAKSLTPYFLLDDDGNIRPIENESALIALLIRGLDDLLPFVFRFPLAYDELYGEYVEPIIYNSLF